MEPASEQPHSSDRNDHIDPKRGQNKDTLGREMIQKNSDPLPGSSTTQPQDDVFKVPLPYSKLPGKQPGIKRRVVKFKKERMTMAATESKDSPEPSCSHWNRPDKETDRVTSPQVINTSRECFPSEVTQNEDGVPGYIYVIPQDRALQINLLGKRKSSNRENIAHDTVKKGRRKIKSPLKRVRLGQSTNNLSAADPQIPGSSKTSDQYSRSTTEATTLDQLPGTSHATDATALEQSLSPQELTTKRRRPYRAHISPEKPRRNPERVSRKRPFPYSSDEPNLKKGNQQRIQKISPKRPGPSKWIPRSLSRVNLPVVSGSSVVINKLDDGSAEKLGEGAYGYVLRGSLTDNTDIVAKHFKPSAASKEEILSEARILHLLEDTDIVPKVYGLMDTDEEDQPVLVQECVGGGLTLDDMLDTRKSVSKQTWFNCCLQATKGLDRIHKKGVLINDIKEDNILIDYQTDTPKVKFIDMGIATFKSSFVGEGNMKGCHHIAPEVQRHKPSSIKSDIYGLGYVMTTIGKRADVPELLRLGNRLMVKDPSKRPALSEVVSWLTALDNFAQSVDSDSD